MNTDSFVTVILLFMLGLLGVFIAINNDNDKNLKQLNQRVSCLENGGSTIIDYSMQDSNLKVEFKCMKNNQMLFGWER